MLLFTNLLATYYKSTKRKVFPVCSAMFISVPGVGDCLFLRARGVGNRTPSKKKIPNLRGYAWGGGGGGW